MSKLPYFPCYARDVLSSSKIALMGGDAFKAYWLLLCASWLEDERATLPNNEAKLEALARVDASTWLKIKNEVLACFDTDRNGRLFSPRLLEVSFLQEKRRGAGSKGGSKTQAGPEANYEANFKQTTKHHSQSQSQSQNKSQKKESEKEKNKSVPNQKSGPKPYPIRVDEYFNTLNEESKDVWKEAYPNVSLEDELRAAKAWLLSNPQKAKKDLRRFINGWLGRAMERHHAPSEDLDHIRALARM